MIGKLIIYLTRNRAGTRTGRATWLYFGLWALLMITNELLVHTGDTVFIGFALLSPFILLLNRLDRSGPTVEEAVEAAGAQRVIINKIMFVVAILTAIMFIYCYYVYLPSK